MGFGAIGFLGTQAVGVVLVAPGGGAVGHACQLTAIPGVSPCAVVQRIADLVMGDGHAVVSRQQVAPGAVSIGVAHRGECFAKFAGGVGVLRLGEDVAAVVVRPDPSLARRLIVLSG